MPSKEQSPRLAVAKTDVRSVGNESLSRTLAADVALRFAAVNVITNGMPTMGESDETDCEIAKSVDAESEVKDETWLKLPLES